MKTVRIPDRIFSAIQDDIADLRTFRAMPTNELPMIDPFLFLNHHGYQIYSQNNRGLPFGPHPHRGFETVTFILNGDIAHQDSSGHASIIGAGGVQWMTTGRGLIHSETSSNDFKQHGGPLEILQLWVNLPAKLKMTTPKYKGLQRDEIPEIKIDPLVTVNLISGSLVGHRGPFENLTDVTTMTINFRVLGVLELEIAPDRNIFFYVVSGSVMVNGRSVSKRETLTFKNEGLWLQIEATSDSVILLCHATPLGEPVVSYGPFVMNSKEEINHAIMDYKNGKFN